MYCPCPYETLHKTAALVGLSDARFCTGLDFSTMTFGLIIYQHVVIECWFLHPVVGTLWLSVHSYVPWSACCDWVFIPTSCDQHVVIECSFLHPVISMLWLSVHSYILWSACCDWVFIPTSCDQHVVIECSFLHPVISMLWLSVDSYILWSARCDWVFIPTYCDQHVVIECSFLHPVISTLWLSVDSYILWSACCDWVFILMSCAELYKGGWGTVQGDSKEWNGRGQCQHHHQPGTVSLCGQWDGSVEG